MSEREDNVYKAKLAEQAERYDGKCIVVNPFFYPINPPDTAFSVSAFPRLRYRFIDISDCQRTW